MKLSDMEQLIKFLSEKVPNKFGKIIEKMERLRERFEPHTLRMTFNNNLPLTTE